MAPLAKSQGGCALEFAPVIQMQKVKKGGRDEGEDGSDEEEGHGRVQHAIDDKELAELH